MHEWKWEKWHEKIRKSAKLYGKKMRRLNKVKETHEQDQESS